MCRVFIFLTLSSASCGGRWMKAMSPSSMTMPTMSTWDSMYQQHGGPPSHGPPPRPPTGPGTPGVQPAQNHQQRPPSVQGMHTILLLTFLDSDSSYFFPLYNIHHF